MAQPDSKTLNRPNPNPNPNPNPYPAPNVARLHLNYELMIDAILNLVLLSRRTMPTHTVSMSGVHVAAPVDASRTFADLNLFPTLSLTLILTLTLTLFVTLSITLAQA